MGNGLPRRHKEHKERLKVIKNRIKRIANRVRGWGIWITNPCRLPFVPSLGFNALYSLRHCGELNCCTKEGLRRIYYTILWTFVLGMFCTTLYAHSDGAPLSCLGAGVDKFNVTYAAPSMFTCGQLGCHYQYPINSGKEKLKLFVVDKCTPGEVVDILISFEKAKSDFHGFQITAQDSYFGNRLVGTFINVGDDE
ncbi:MAG: hypothetical protein KGQ83_10815, partial [Planctomycetes bacterium]|nr:hypothetical protein [Planctomycetota bacterium]